MNYLFITNPQFMKRTLIIFNLFFSVFIIQSCSKSTDTASSNTSAQTATFSVSLVDAPVAYDKVLIDIQDVQVKASTDASDTGWKSLTIGRKGVYNVLDFKNGLDTLLGKITLPAGTISQLRLVLGTNNSVVYNGISSSMQTPSAQQSGLKLLINATIQAGVDYKYWIDFDAAKSIVHTGNNNFILKPVIKVFNEATSGAIKGVVSPANTKSVLFAITSANDTVASTQADTTTGSFLLRGIAAGNYAVNIHVTNGSYKDSTKNNVTVTNGFVTDLTTITLHQ